MVERERERERERETERERERDRERDIERQVGGACACCWASINVASKKSGVKTN